MSITKINSYISKILLTISAIFCIVPFETKRKSLIVLNRIYALICILTLIPYTIKYNRSVNYSTIFLMLQSVVIKPSKSAMLVEKIRAVENKHGAKFTGFISICLLISTGYFIHLLLHALSNNLQEDGFYGESLGRFMYCFLSFINGFIVLVHKKHFEVSNKRVKASFKRGYSKESGALEVVLLARNEYKKSVDDLENYNEIFGMYFLIATTMLVIVGASSLYKFMLVDYDAKFLVVEKDVPFLAIAVVGNFFSIFCCDSAVEEGKNLKGICFDILDGPLDDRWSQESYQRVLELIDFIENYPPVFSSNGFLSINRCTILSIINNLMTYLIVVFTW